VTIGTIVDRILDRGFYANAYKGSHGNVISIQKESKGQLWTRAWRIDQIELEQSPKEALFAQADHYMDEVDSAIATYKEQGGQS
jgi:hypothetical protein